MLETLRGKPPHRPPVWFMRQAGRYLPEYKALRVKAKNFIEFCLTPDLAAEVTLQPIRRFNMDAAILFADILLIPYALGQNVSFVDGEGPKLDPIRGETDIAQLSRIRSDEMLAPVMETIRNVRARLPPEVALIGFAGASWTVATYMIEGKGGTDYERSRRMAWSEPALFATLLDILVESTITYLLAQIEAGAELLQLFDSWAGSVPAPLFETAVIGPTKRIVDAIKQRHPEIPIIGFPRGAGATLKYYAAKTGVDAVGVDYMTDLAFAAQSIPDNIAIQGNLDPVLLASGGEAMDQQIRNILGLMGQRPFIFNLGHGVMQSTPPEHVTRAISLVRVQRVD